MFTGLQNGGFTGLIRVNPVKIRVILVKFGLGTLVRLHGYFTIFHIDAET